MRRTKRIMTAAERALSEAGVPTVATLGIRVRLTKSPTRREANSRKLLDLHERLTAALQRLFEEAANGVVRERSETPVSVRQLEAGIGQCRSSKSKT
jgi:hypothetical protein